jgi:hypothetical protein
MKMLLIAWGIPLVLFVLVLIFNSIRENALMRRDESAIDPIFRQK